ncbi:efflux RND transporter periplasmic adaptor subunit [Gemmatimonas groenlandica]|uniref:Biotin/lipoyl-binding protein n=1 Tax=Gemmatimonas groenlandica TaxID=2732249 RepID=A0A6M4IV07_9BACT|nr:biotin/lipoyl-binding protein [Gemmatimonas groenlandica]QJR36652.1 biotin/lipoyl-binding protein [Gemmatimonas groenlandica]
MRTSILARARSIGSRHVLHALAIGGTLTALLVSFSSSPAAPSVAVRSSPPPAIPFRDYVSGAALIESANQDVMIAAPTAGVLSAMHVRVGDAVKAGDPLFTLDQRSSHAEVATRSAALAVARAELVELQESASKATLDEQRVSTIDDPRAVSDEERTSRRSALRMAQAQVATASAKVLARAAELEAALVSQNERVVRAPMNGTVLNVSARPGEAVGGTGSSAPVRLGRVDRLHVRVDIDENDAWRIRAGTRARLIMRGNDRLMADLQYEYTERYVRPKMSLTGASTERVDTRVLQLVYSLPSDRLPLYVGQQVDVIVEIVKHNAEGQ